MKIIVSTVVAAPIEDVWRAYTTPEDIKLWNAASPDWHTTAASVDLRPGGKFSSRMEAKDGSFGFDFAGEYTRVVPHRLIEYSFGDRLAVVEFTAGHEGVTVTVTFDGETTHSEEQQRSGWQAILDNFARHVEGKLAQEEPAGLVKPPSSIVRPHSPTHAETDMPSMKRIQFTETINALAAVVWRHVTDPDSYKLWASAFAEGSCFQGSWEPGAKIRFLSPSGDGMVSEIADSKPNEFISIRHVGFIAGGVEDTTSEAIRAWAPAYENYTFLPTAAGTTMVVDQEVAAEWEESLSQAWPKALAILKKLSESSGSA